MLTTARIAYAVILICIFGFSVKSEGQSQQPYIHKGVIYESNGDEMRRFGVNYNTPFAFGYRSHKRLGLDLKAAIDMDVDHIHRLGLDAYRVHIWDREISDKDGNLIDNEHLELFDYLMLKLAEKNIKSVITPMAWWGNGYPEPDLKTGGFSELYEKQEMNTNPQAVKKTVNYLQQLMLHKNRYTSVALGQDPNVLLIELFNEPRHRGETNQSQQYVNTLIAAVKQVGVTKPLMYNISEQGDWQEFAQAICESNIDGVSYQWYPTGLVKMSRLNTNVLANVSVYDNPFRDISSCADKGKMIYEFDAADVTRSVMYPAMARSFRTEGFQWATQFAYDPAETAHTNSEYNTHYLNLLYTPQKAISMLIAGQVFRELPRGYQSKPYPQNNQFENVSVDYHNDLSTFDSAERFYHSNHTDLVPAKSVTHIAGVGNSGAVQYGGSGAYFLDKLSGNSWRLEVYPDVIKRTDPHGPGSMKQHVSSLISSTHVMRLKLPGLPSNFQFTKINAVEQSIPLKNQRAEESAVHVTPGVYILSDEALSASTLAKVDNDYYLPSSVAQSANTKIWHQAQRSFNIGDNIRFTFDIASRSPINQGRLYLKYADHNSFTQLPLTKGDKGRFYSELPKSWTKTGTLEYAVSIEVDGQWLTFSGEEDKGILGTPSDWDFVMNHSLWRSQLRPAGTVVELFNPIYDFDVLIYPKKGHSKWEFIAGDNGLSQALKLGVEGLQDGPNWLARGAIAEDAALRYRDLSSYRYVVLKIKGHSKTEYVEFSLLNQDGLALGKTIEVGPNWQYHFIKLDELTPTNTMLTKSYPMFLPSEVAYPAADLGELELLQGFQLRFDAKSYGRNSANKWHGVEIEYVALMQKD